MPCAYSSRMAKNYRICPIRIEIIHTPIKKEKTTRMTHTLYPGPAFDIQPVHVLH
jgi:hypothetical protein